MIENPEYSPKYTNKCCISSTPATLKYVADGNQVRYCIMNYQCLKCSYNGNFCDICKLQLPKRWSVRSVWFKPLEFVTLEQEEMIQESHLQIETKSSRQLDLLRSC